MINSILSEQLLQVCYMMSAGAFTLILLDILHEIGRLAKWNKYTYIIAEFTAIVVIGTCLFIFLIVRYNGLLRVYSLLSLLLGITAYYSLLRPYGSSVCHTIAKGILWLYRKITGVLLFPWRKFYCHVVRRAKKKVQQVKKRRQEAKSAVPREMC